LNADNHTLFVDNGKLSALLIMIHASNFRPSVPRVTFAPVAQMQRHFNSGVTINIMQRFLELIIAHLSDVLESSLVYDIVHHDVYTVDNFASPPVKIRYNSLDCRKETGALQCCQWHA